MSSPQHGILSDNLAFSRHLFFSMTTDCQIKSKLTLLAEFVNTDDTIIGLGHSLTSKIKLDIGGLKTMPSQTHLGISIPSTPQALWCCLRGDDQGELYHRSDAIRNLLTPDFTLEQVIDCFTHDQNRDLSGYEDGTENPEGDEAIDAAILQDSGPLNGSSFVAVMQWQHDFDKLKQMSEKDKDNTIGRHHADNEEFDAPESAHVKRAAQEDFEPEAFMLRRSMPWSDGMDAGLVFVAFGKSFNAFEAVLNRMLGADDGIQDALFTFTQPKTGAYFWCPPSNNGKLDLSAL